MMDLIFSSLTHSEGKMTAINEKYVPVRAVFEATLGCNLRCRHCGSRAGRARRDELSTAECADLFRQLAELGTRWLTISGGEPTTRKDWPALVEAAARTEMRVGMITNGILFSADSAEIARDNGLNAVGFSLDGDERTHDLVRGRVGHFQRLMRAVDSARSAELPFAVVTHVNRRNVGQLAQMHDRVVELGAYAWQVQLGTDMGNMSDNPDLLAQPRDVIRVEKELAALVKKSPIRVHVSDSIGYFGPHEKLLRKAIGQDCFKGCPAGIRVIGVESNGNVKGCLSIMAGYNEQGADYVEGNVREERLADIWYRPGAFAYNREFDLDDLGGFCRACEHASICRGGCTAKKVASGNGVENPMCVHRALDGERRLGSRIGQAAAAVVLAAALGASAQACNDSGDDDDNNDSGGDTDTDTDTDSDTDTDTDSDSDSDSDTDTDTDTDADTDSDTDVTDYGMPEYGIPDTDTGGEDYGMPDTDG
jgi:radical SAM protein with 4Fe4S-binding SPASM domain